MFLNVVFLAGGIGVGYLIRGEIDRRKSKKAWSVALDEGLKIAEKLVNDISAVKKDEDTEGDTAIDLDSISNLFDIADPKNESNSTDETIQL